MSAIYYALLNLLQALFLALWSLFWISAALLVSLFSRELPLAMARRFWGPGLVWGAQTRVEVEFTVPLDPAQPYVFAMNHESMIDIPIAFAVIPHNLRFVAKQILRAIPFLGWYMQRTGMIFVDRGNRAQALASLREAGRKIRAGASILAYPEGTRSRDGRVLPFKKGVFVVAIESGVPIIPVAITGSGQALPSDGFRIRPATVRVRLGAPIATAERQQSNVKQLMRDVRDALIDLHRAAGGRGGDDAEAIAAPGRAEVGRSPRLSEEVT